jgi:N-acetylated-alpha-linked acidic dipeptidase
MLATACALASTVLAAPPITADPGLRWFAPDAQTEQLKLESILLDTPDPDRLAAWHELLGSEPHVAGTPGDHRNIDRMVRAFESMGLDVERHAIWPYLAEPIDATVEIVSPVHETLPLGEAVLESDPHTAHPDRPMPFNAFAGSGDVTGEVVYVNRGRKEDFDRLAELGVDLTGKIAIARYGGNYRGYKARFAEAAGAAGLLIYTDPADSGYMRGLPYPEGGWANGTSIQRGSIVTLPYKGDVLTPFVEATKDAERLPPERVDLPTIPVQPIGWAAADRVLSKMSGRPLPQDWVGTWQGGLPFAYRIEGGPELRVRVAVEQKRAIRETANVIARLEGATHPEQMIVIGCHHDAWGFGAGDPLAGLICVMETARCFAAAAEQGFRPERTIVFAAWAAEEHGIIGSTEWCEANAEALSANGVAYINLDMAAMGTRFGSSASPTLKTIIAEATKAVPQARDDKNRNVYAVWTRDGERDAPVGSLGGGSDHIGFYGHIGMPACGLGAWGSPGVSYHSNYDTLAWYRQVVGDDYEPARMVARVASILAARLANATILPLEPLRYARDARSHVDALATRADAIGVEIDLEPLLDAIDRYEEHMRPAWDAVLEALAAGRLDSRRIQRINQVLLRLERAWIDEPGLPGRPWFRNLYAATDPTSGYAAWMLPGIRAAIESGDRRAIEEAIARCKAAIERLCHASRRLDSIFRASQ